MKEEHKSELEKFRDEMIERNNIWKEGWQNLGKFDNKI